MDYAAEAKDEAENNVKPETVKLEDGLNVQLEPSSAAEEETVGAPRSSRTYDYRGEVVCDGNAEIFMDSIRAVKSATPDGFAAIKFSGLGDPLLLERMSTCLVEIGRLFKRLSGHEEASKEPFFAMDRNFFLDFDTFSKGWRRLFAVGSEEELKELFHKLDADRDGMITYLDWSSGMPLSEINSLVRSCIDHGPLYHAALDKGEMKLYWNLINRVKRIMELSQELQVRVMVDAEWMDIQPAIDHIVLFLQRKYNTGDQPIVFNTYQCYLKGMDARVRRDLQRSSKEGWKFGAKVVRGAYVVSEREKALKRGVESPVCEIYEDTEANFHASIDAILEHKAANGSAGELLVASHNRGSIEHTVKRMKELKKSKDQVYFGQLLGMADHLTFTLGANGYKAYKYIPYGPIEEVVPYLIRRTQENSAILGSAGVQEERRMVTRELRRRFLGF